ncbi:hypothetical protein GALMADRAFT_238657 [Galerina marginata CBS 339.88]|uniref:MYND-type domain-containing protein n=1 Tax=Galerina marginata (strain CBS 339.88) TaxID=685588 RepID=A0A067TIM1_GALM3|nr:hypothetical protein GALMADRAFT_238657 [Galerina marginata CBS 339.88]
MERCGSEMCQKTSHNAKLRLCAACGEAAYCSSDCQKIDWKSHKVYCGKTDRVDLQTYYPFLAVIASMCHLDPDDLHPALTHKIVNTPHPNGGDIVDLPNGSSAKLVLLGEPIPLTAIHSREWWPTGDTDDVRHKLLRRIASEGLQLPVALATCIAIVSEIYTTTAIPASEKPDYQFSGRRRVRLSYNHSPIQDFGVVYGSVRVTNQDRLAYYSLESDEFLMGQDPEDHYWIYFTTLAGDEYFLDSGMMTFNFSAVINASPYHKFESDQLPPHVPAFFYGRDQQKAIPLTNRILWNPRGRFSVLREPRLYSILGKVEKQYCSCHDFPVISSIMDEIAGHRGSQWEKERMMNFLPYAVHLIRMNVHDREYLNFPKEPTVGFLLDPVEFSSTEEVAEDLFNYLTKWARKLKKGKISPERWEAAFRAWKEQPFAARTRDAVDAKSITL